MGLTTPTADLTGNTIADTYDQLLILDNAAGMVDSTLKIVSTQTGHSALQITNDQILIKDKSGTDIASCFEVQDKDATVCLSVNGTNNRVGIGTAAPQTLLHVGGSDVSVATHAYSLVELEGSGNTALQISTPNANVGYIFFGAPQGSSDGQIAYAQSSRKMSFGTAGSSRVTIAPDGDIGIGTDSPSFKLDLRAGSATIAAAFAAAGNDTCQIQIGDNSEQAYFGVSDDNDAVWIGQTAGASAANLNINEAGDVGIGTISPTSQLDITDGTSPRFSLVDSGATTNRRIFSISSVNDITSFDCRNNANSGAGDGGTMMSFHHEHGSVNMPKQPAFMARPASDQTNFAIGSDVPINFGTETTDQGGDYDGSNTFTAPIAGNYLFSANIHLENLDAQSAYYAIKLKTSNRTYSLLVDPDFETGDSDQDLPHYSMSLSILADMDASDTAYVAVAQNNGASAQTDVNQNSSFSGYLAC